MNRHNYQNYSRVVVTCGVSMFGSANVYRKWGEDNKLLGFEGSKPNPIPPARLNEQQAVEQWNQACRRPQTESLANESPKNVSAEYSALHALRRMEWLADHPTVVLIHTASLGGEAAATMLALLLKRNFGAKVMCEAVDMTVGNSNLLRFQLGTFMHKLAQSLVGHDPGSTCFAPLGGYKVMTSLGYLAGAYLGHPTLYLHEDEQTVHQIPAVPIRMPTGDLKRVAPLMKRCAAGCAVSDLAESDLPYLDEFSWLFERQDDMTFLNAMGIFLMQSTENSPLFAPRILVSRKIHEEFDKDGRRAFVLQQLEVLGVKLAAGSPEKDLQHEHKWPVKGSAQGRHLYNGASNGQQVFRCIYRFDGSALHAYATWCDHARYETEFPNTWARSDVADIDWSERQSKAA